MFWLRIRNAVDKVEPDSDQLLSFGSNVLRNGVDPPESTVKSAAAVGAEKRELKHTLTFTRVFNCK